MTDVRPARKLTADEVTFSLSPDQFGYQSTAELSPLDAIVGQSRALRALDLGLGIAHPNYHIYVAGMTGTGRMEMLRAALAERIDERPIPSDWMYVNNFDEPDRPLAIDLPPGQGARFKREMEDLIDTLFDALPKAFQEEDFSREKDHLRKEYQQQSEDLLEELTQPAREIGIAVQMLPDGQLLFIPLKDGRPMTPEEMQTLNQDEVQDIERRQQQVMEIAEKVMLRRHEMERQLTLDVRRVEQAFAMRLIKPLIARIADGYESAKLRHWLDRMAKDLVDHLGRFRQREGRGRVPTEPGEAHAEERFIDYQVNVIVDNSKLKHAPIILEDAPTYQNLFGIIERVVDRFGRVATNYTRIKAGSLLKANGGYLVFNLMDALTEPFVWKELKRRLKSGLLEIEIYDPFSMFTVSALKPEVIPLKTRLVALGDPLVYHLLYLYDEDFREIFRVKADFDTEMQRNNDAGQIYGRFVRRLSETEGLLPFQADGVAELIRAGVRLADERSKISTEFSRVADLVRESEFWARRDGVQQVTAAHVRQAQDEHVFRSDLVASKIREWIADGTLLIDLQGEVVGQVNGLAVANLGDYAFGRPSRITASVGVGATGIVNIERESRLSGKTYDKGLLILEGVLRNTYARDTPLSLTAGLTMEQSYGGIDGDSASVAELLSLLSALAEIPLRQDIAVTGSINQWGQVQAIGGVNEKIEGFFDVCHAAGLTTTQGVCIPEANVKNLVLRPDVVEAIEAGQFHVWAVGRLDQAIELLSGLPAGDTQLEGSFHQRVAKRLSGMSDALKGQTPPSVERVTAAESPPALPPDPRPPAPAKGRLQQPSLCGTNRPQGVERANVDCAVRDRGRGREGFLHFVLFEDLELASCLDHADDAVAGAQKDLAVGVHRRSAVTLPMRAVEVDLLARVGLQAQQVAVFAAQIDQPVVNQRRGHVRRVVLADPHVQRFDSGDVALSVGTNREDRAVFGGGNDDHPRYGGRRSHEPQRGMIALDRVVVRVQATQPPDLAAVVQIVGNGEVGPVRDQELAFPVRIDDGRGVGMFVLGVGLGDAILLPDALAGPLIQRDNQRFVRAGFPIAVNELQVKSISVQNGRRGHPKSDIEPAVPVLQVHFPDFFAVDRIAADRPVGHHRPDVFAVGRRGRGGGIPFVDANDFIPPAHGLLPEPFSVGADAEQIEILAIDSG
jgi:predicted ATP-dependent protease